MVQLSCGEEGEQTVMKSRCCCCCLCNLRLGRHARKPVSLLFVALKAVESVLLIVDCFTFCFLCTHGCQRRSSISIRLNLGLQTRHSFATFSGLFGKRTVRLSDCISQSQSHEQQLSRI